MIQRAACTILFLVFFCSTPAANAQLSKVRRDVHRTLVEALAKTTSTEAQWAKGCISVQRKQRDLCLAELDRLIQLDPSQVLVMREWYPSGCFSCPAQWIEIVGADVYIRYERSAIDGQYEKTTSHRVNGMAIGEASHDLGVDVSVFRHSGLIIANWPSAQLLEIRYDGRARFQAHHQVVPVKAP